MSHRKRIKQLQLVSVAKCGIWFGKILNSLIVEKFSFWEEKIWKFCFFAVHWNIWDIHVSPRNDLKSIFKYRMFIEKDKFVDLALKLQTQSFTWFDVLIWFPVSFRSVSKKFKAELASSFLFISFLHTSFEWNIVRTRPMLVFYA